MKFMINYNYQDKYLPTLEVWGSRSPRERADVGGGVTLIGRWHYRSGGTGSSDVHNSLGFEICNSICRCCHGEVLRPRPRRVGR